MEVGMTIVVAVVIVFFIINVVIVIVVSTVVVVGVVIVGVGTVFVATIVVNGVVVVRGIADGVWGITGVVVRNIGMIVFNDVVEMITNLTSMTIGEGDGRWHVLLATNLCDSVDGFCGHW
jgi:hypothetical protein